MRQIYTNESYVEAMHSKNRLESANIPVEFRNEFASGAAIGGHALWPELWVNDADYDTALKLLAGDAAEAELKDWICHKCREMNPGNFRVCWKCQANSPQDLAQE